MPGRVDFEDFFENGDLPLHVIASDGTILGANKAELDLLGYTADEYVGRDIRAFHIDPAAIADILARLSRGEKLKSHPARLRAKDGSMRHVEITSSGKFENGALASSRCFTVDVTETKLAARSSRETEAYWRAVLDALPAAVYTTDAEGRITYFNEAAVELSGRTPQLRSDSWCVTWRLFGLNGKPMPHTECPMAEALKQDVPIRGAEAIAERPDGTRVRFEPFPTPLHDENGKLIGAVNLLLDVTEKRSLEEDAARLAAIVLSADDAIVGKTLDGIVTSWNDGARRIFGYEPDEMIGQPILRIIPPELHPEEQEILAKLRRGERIDHYETERVAKDGHRIDISLSVSPVRDRMGKLIGAAKVARDVTQRKKAEATRLLLMGELNHRVKNTLATVQSIASQTLRSAKSPAEFVPSFLGRIQSLASAHGLLTQSNWQGVEMGALIRSQLLFEEEADDRIFCSGPDIVLQPQTALHLSLVLHELGTNARKHGALTAPQGRVVVEWSIRASPLHGLNIHWSETGGPAVHGDALPSGGFGTTLIERSMSSIEGGGAQMHLNAHGISWDIWLPLPITATQSAPTFEARHNVPEIVSGRTALASGQRILVVDDEVLVAMDMESILRDAGYRVVGPASAIDEAIGLAMRSDFDAALIDANLGGKPVDQLAVTLTRRKIPFAFVTGYGRESLPRAFASAPVLTKPFGATTLVNMVKQILSTHALLMRRDDRRAR